MTSTVLAVLAVFLLRVAFELRRRHDPNAGTFAIAAAGALFLAGDDLLALHETVGHNLGFLTSVPGIDHPDDAVMGIYALIVIGFCFHHRELAPAGTTARTAFLVAAVIGALSILLDMLPIDYTRPEEGLEVLCAVGLLAGAVLTARLALGSSVATEPVPAASRSDPARPHPAGRHDVSDWPRTGTRRDGRRQLRWKSAPRECCPSYAALALSARRSSRSSTCSAISIQRSARASRRRGCGRRASLSHHFMRSRLVSMALLLESRSRPTVRRRNLNCK